MAPTRRRVLAMAGVTLGLAGCIGDDDDDPGTDPTPTPDDDGDDTDEPTPTPDDDTDGAASVEALADSFDPDLVTIDVGETVEWTNASAMGHTVTLYADRVPDGVEQTSEALGTDETVEKTFDTEGVHDYYCQPHHGMGMVGTVVVGEPTADEPGLQPPADDLPGAAQTALDDLNARVREQFDLDGTTDDTDDAGDDESDPTPTPTPDDEDDDNRGGGGYGGGY